VTIGDEINPFYDPMVAKIVAHAETRELAIAALRDGCGGVAVWPVKTNAGFLARCLAEPRFVAGNVDTGFIPARGASLTDQPAPSEDFLSMLATTILFPTKYSGGEPWTRLQGFRLNAAADVKLRLKMRGEEVVVRPDDKCVVAGVGGRLRQGDREIVFLNGEAYEFTLDTGERSADEATAGDGAILSPMPGKIVSVAAEAGAKLKKGDPILVLEAMKMEHTLTAPFDGKLTELNAKAGAQVSEGVLLAKLEKE
jgi:acetyl/propionyl-CoA carboxylase alpha subunit